MLRYIIVRTIWIFVVLFTFLSILFITIRLVDEPPLIADKDQLKIHYEKKVSYGLYTARYVDTFEEVEKCQETYGKKKCGFVQTGDIWRIYEPVPISKQYINWIKNIFTKFDWGYSTYIKVNEDVFSIIGDRIGVTIRLNFISLFVYIPIGFALGIIAALNKNKFVDNVIMLSVMILISIPSFVMMFLLLLFFGYYLDWVPTQFPSAQATGSVVYTSLVIPVLGLSLGSIAGLARMTRAELTEVLTSDFLLLARTKGLTRKQSVIRHALRNSMVPLVPSIIFAFVSLISGSVIIEMVYGIPGMGRLYIQSLQKGSMDYNVNLALSAIYTTISLFAVLFVDLSYGIVDPRIRMGARK